MKTEWDLDVDIVTFTLTSETIEQQVDEYPVVLDLNLNGDIVEIEVVLPAQLDVVDALLKSRNVDDVTQASILNTVGYANMRALMLRTPNIPQPHYLADPNEVTVSEFEDA